MAEVGVHLATTSTELPSIFEVLAQENLNWTLRPAFGYLTKVLAEFDPSCGRLAFLYKWRDEIFTGFDFVLQHYCLKACGASFAEQFYGLRRQPVDVDTRKSANGFTKTGYMLPASVHRWSLFSLVFMPYLKLRVDSLYENLVGTEELAPSTAENRTRRRRLLVRAFLCVYPYLHLLWEMSVLCHQVGYALGKQKFPSPLYRLARSQLVSVNEEDAVMNPIIVVWNEIRKVRSWRQLPSFLYQNATKFYTELFTAALSLGMFFLRFLEWRYTASQTTVNAVSMLSPPILPRDPVEDVTNCPICRKTRSNEATLSTSGYVFCYPCIHRHIKLHGSCPVTRLPSTTANIVRLFSDADASSSTCCPCI